MQNEFLRDADLIENLDTPIGKEILDCLLLKTGSELTNLLEEYTLQDFIDERCEAFYETLTSGYQSSSYQNGPIGHTGVLELARAEAFRDL